jgi:RHS repeat-associated protein
VRKKADNSFVYDYFIKDHLGNTRMVLTEEREQDTYPAATFEDGTVGVDSQYYNITPSNIRDTGLITGFSAAANRNYQNNNGNPPYNTNPFSVVTGVSKKMYLLDGSAGNTNGLGTSLKVMSGDTMTIFAKSFWHSNGVAPSNGNNIPVSDLLAAMAGTGAVIHAGKGITEAGVTGSGSILTALTHWVQDTVTTTSGKPRAYINWVLFDEQFKIVSASSGFKTVGNADEITRDSIAIDILKNGYLYIYCSNESNKQVFFDNFQVVHSKGPLLEETHYYPFGLTMAGISSKAAGKLENRKDKFQGQELDDDLGLHWYGFKWRNHDPQIGRFAEIDPLSDKYVHNSTYAFSENKVTGHVELEGLEAVAAQPLTVEKAKKFADAVGNVMIGAVAVMMAPFNMMGDMHAAGNTKNPQRKSELEQSAKNNAALTVEGIITGGAMSALGKSVAGATSIYSPTKTVQYIGQAFNRKR